MIKKIMMLSIISGTIVGAVSAVNSSTSTESKVTKNIEIYNNKKKNIIVNSSIPTTIKVTELRKKYTKEQIKSLSKFIGTPAVQDMIIKFKKEKKAMTIKDVAPFWQSFVKNNSALKSIKNISLPMMIKDATSLWQIFLKNNSALKSTKDYSLISTENPNILKLMDKTSEQNKEITTDTSEKKINELSTTQTKDEQDTLTLAITDQSHNLTTTKTPSLEKPNKKKLSAKELTAEAELMKIYELLGRKRPSF